MSLLVHSSDYANINLKLTRQKAHLDLEPPRFRTCPKCIIIIRSPETELPDAVVNCVAGLNEANIALGSLRLSHTSTILHDFIPTNGNEVFA